MGVKLNQLTSQPSALAFISATNMWERFGFYMMRSILVLYMANVFLFSNQKTYGIFATFSALLYITPQIGGHLSDRFFGRKYMVSLGGLLLSTGYFLLALPGLTYFYFGLSTIIVGSGFFVPNISGILGEFYLENDVRREGGFSILYSAINFGALIPPLISAGLITKFGWHTAFAIAGLGVLFGVIIFNIGLMCISQFKNIKNPLFTKNHLLLAPLTLLGIFFFSSLLTHARIAHLFLFISGAFMITYTIKSSFSFSPHIRNRLIFSFILTTFSILFWALYAQGAMSLTLFTENNVRRQISWGIIPTMMFLALSPLFIILLGPAFAKLWLWLDSKNLNLSIPAKFSLGTIFMGAGFLIIPLAILLQSTAGQIHFGWIILSYFLQSVGELLISPVGLSMMTNLAPKNIVGLMIGTWYFAMAIANILGGLISAATVASSKMALFSYMQTFEVFGGGAILVGMGIMLFSAYLNNMISSKLA